jgi:asparagine synthase (glutamine-hydrolysing)
MCGIIGAVESGVEGRKANLEQARDLMRHRGPDDAGLWSVQGVALGFRRLAILDLSSAGNQPMLSPDGRLTLVFNGEIYNYRELRRDLEKGYSFRSQTDSEVLLAGFATWGWEELLRRIDGMFAFAIWDDLAQTLYAARDRVGKKPLFYALTSRGLAFASTLNALRVLLPARPEIDTVALDAYLTYQAVPAPMTIYKNVYQLPPAHQLVFELPTKHLSVARYWDLHFAPKVRQSESEALDELDNLVREAVRKRLRSDVPLGAFLSGGVDSSLVVAMMAQESDRQVEATVMGFDDPVFDERSFSRLVARKWDVRLHEHVLQPQQVADLPKIIWHCGQPLADVSLVPTYYVARAARTHVKVILNGDGGDELFGGYARPVVARAAQYYRRLLPAPVRRTIEYSLAKYDGRGLLGYDRALLRRLRMLTRAGQGAAIDSFVYYRAFRDHRIEAYSSMLKNVVGEGHPDALYRTIWQQADGVDDVDRALYGDFRTFLPDQLLPKMDISTMAHGLEARSPLLDTALIEYAARIPTELRLQGFTTKYLLKRLAERYVPHEVLYRRKRGFVMPASDWLGGELLPYVRASLQSSIFRERGWIQPGFVDLMLEQHVSGRRNWGEQLWTLFVLEVWSRLTIDESLEQEDSLEALMR